MARWYEAANQASFKPVPEGFIFQAPNPWVFGWPHYYVVSETQKAAILPYMGRWRLLLMLTLLAEALLLGAFIAFVKLSPATFLALSKPAFQFGIGVFAVGMFVLLMLLMAPLIVLPQLYLNRGLAPILATAPRTNARIAFGDQLPKIANSASGKVLALGLVGGLCVMAAAIAALIEAYFESRLIEALLFPFLPLILFGGLVTTYFGYLVRLRASMKRDAMTKIE